MKLSILAGATSQSVNVFIRDSSSTTGGGLTGLAYNTASLTAYYTHSGTNATATAITLATLAAVTSAYSSGGFKEIDATNMPGWYRFDIPNACLATSKGRSVAIHLKGATNMAPCPIEIELTGWDNQLVPGAAGGMFIAGGNASTTFDSLTVTNAFTVNGVTSFKQNVSMTSDSTYGLTITGSSGAISATSITLSGSLAVADTVTFSKGLTANITGNLSGSVGSVTAITTSGGKVSGVILADTLTTYTGNTPQTGDAYDRIGATGSGLTSLAPSATALSTATWTSTRAGYIDNLNPAGTGSVGVRLADARTHGGPDAVFEGETLGDRNGNITGIVTGSVGSVVGSVGSVASGGIAAASFASGAITAAAIAADAIGASELAADAVAEIQSGLATTSALVTVASYIDTEVAAIKAVTDKLDTTLVLDGSVYQFTANALELAPSGGGGGSAPTVEEIDAYLSAEHGAGSWESGGTGGGARSVTATVNDGAAALESARVRFTKGAESYVTSTNASGVATFSLDDGTWTVTISLAGYTFTPTTMVVNGTEAQTYSMTLADDVPEVDGLVNLQATCVDEFGEPAPGVVVSIRLKDTPTGYGLFGSSAPQSATSDENGVVRFTGGIKGAVYTIKSPRDVRMYTIPATATSPHTLPNIVR